jgi:nicotinamidase-related amidase
MTRTALLVVDMLSAYDFEDAERLAENVERQLPQMKRLVERATEQKAPVIYVNDNLGSWRSDQDALVQQVLEGKFARLVEPIVPSEDALFVVKARHSIFYETPLEYLLRAEEIDRVVMVGQVTEQCILYSALDAHIRHIPVIVPRDAVAHIDPELADAALRMMELNMEAEVVDSDDVSFGDGG